MINRGLLAILAVVVAVGVGYLALAWRPPIGAVEPPAAADFSQDAIARGAELAEAGYCASCHTLAGGADYAGGRGIVSDFGTIYATNITPDPEYGIGTWSEAAFARAMHAGVRRDGAHLFPAFPYTHFAKLSDTDVAALYAYFMTREPVADDVPETELPFPFGIRGLQGGWKVLYFRGGRFRPDAEQSEAWNRGAYLAEGLGHCSACHSPRNSLGAEQSGAQRYAGALIDDWYAPAINASPDAPLPWTSDELYAYLRTGASPLHGAAAGSMAEVVHGLAALPDADIQALAAYFSDLGDAPADVSNEEVAAVMRRPADLNLFAAQDRGAQLFASYCVSCHLNAPGAPSAARPELALNSAVVGPDPSNFLRAVLHGVSEPDGAPDASMPSFDLVLSDQDVVDIADFLRATYASDASAAWNDLAARSNALRQLN